jgi:hypothetical protein
MPIRQKSRKTASVRNCKTPPTVSSYRERLREGDKQTIQKIWGSIIDSLTHVQLCQLVDHNQCLNTKICESHRYSELIRDNVGVLSPIEKIASLTLFPGIADKVIDKFQHDAQEYSDNHFNLIQYLLFCVDYHIPLQIIVSQHSNYYNYYRHGETPVTSIYIHIEKIYKRHFTFNLPTDKMVVGGILPTIPIKFSLNMVNVIHGLYSTDFYIRDINFTCKDMIKHSVSLRMINPKVIMCTRKTLECLPEDLIAIVVKYIV